MVIKMSECVIYPSDNGGVIILFPVKDCGLTVEQVALKDVPYGKPFKIINVSDLPSDISQSAAWVVNEEDLTDGFGADYGVGSDKPFIMPEDK